MQPQYVAQQQMPMPDPPFMADCSFCRIARGLERPPELLFATDDWLAFFPLSPATRGHTLVVPRTHIEDFWMLDELLASTLARACLHVGRALVLALSPKGMNLITSRGAAAEQTVHHVHLHVLPRWDQDRIARIWPPEHETDPVLMGGVANDVRNALRDLMVDARQPD